VAGALELAAAGMLIVLGIQSLRLGFDPHAPARDA
jgi:hypothetical protein